MRTLQVGMAWPTEAAGGLTRYYAELLHQLGDAGVEVRGLVIGSSAVECASGGLVRPFAPPGCSLATRVRRLRTCFRRELEGADVSLVVSHFALYTAPCLDLIRGRPLVSHFHGPWALEARAEGAAWLKFRLQLALERAVYHRADAFVVLSQAFGRVLVEWYGVRPERVHVVPGGVDVDRFAVSASRSQARARLRWPPDRPVVLTVRRLTRRMGLENLLQAAALVRRVIPDVLFVIAGRGPLGAELQRRIETSGLAGTVRLLGYVEEAELPLVYRAATLSVVPSVALEGFGLVVLESLAAGTPALVTPVDGMPEVVGPLSPALVLSGSAPPELAEGLVAALGGTLPLPSADECQRYALERFAWPRVAQAVGEVYRAVAG